jgi:HEAT repeat protein
MMAHKPVYRTELVKLYLRYVPLLAERLHHGNEEVKKAARAELDRISAHGLRPLLEALRDDKDVVQQRIAVEVLGYLGNKDAAPPLVHMARQEPNKEQRRIGTLAETLDRDVRVDALVAAGRLGDPSVIAEVLPLMDHQEIAMREAATFTLGRTADRRATAALVKALADRQPSVQVLACLGLAQIDDPRVAPAAVGVVKDAARLDAVRAACAYALGARRIASAAPALLAALDDNRGETQRLAAWALGQLAQPQALGPLVRAYFARAGQSADELVWAIARASSAGLAPAPLADLGEYPLHAGKFDKDAAIAALPGSLPHAPSIGKLVADHASDVAGGLVQALGEHRDVVVSVLSDLDAAPDRIALGALTPAAADPKTAAAVAAIAQTVAPAVAGHLGDDDPKVRALAISVTAKLDTPAAAAAIGKALADPTDQVRAAAMGAIAVLARHHGGSAPPELVAALVKTLSSAGWEDRRVAALALGRLGPHGDPDALVKAAGDASSFVREAVAIALGQVGGPRAASALGQLAHDEVPQVQDAATRSLAQLKN